MIILPNLQDLVLRGKLKHGDHISVAYHFVIMAITIFVQIFFSN